jgi:hypothetical protein
MASGDPAESDVLEAEGTSPDTVLQDCYNDPGTNADDVRTYRTVSIQGHNVAIKLDEYDPTGTAQGVVVRFTEAGGSEGAATSLTPWRISWPRTATWCSTSTTG